MTPSAARKRQIHNNAKHGNTAATMNDIAQNPRHRRADEETPLLANGRTGLAKNESASITERLNKHFAADVSKNWADLVLLFCYIITGLLDSSSVMAWGSFVSMQTG